MTLLPTGKHRLAAVAAAAVVAAGGGTAAVMAAQAPAAPTGVTLSAARGPGHLPDRDQGGPAPRRHLLARADHATFEVKAQGRWVTIDLDRGTVTAVSSTSITLRRPDGVAVTETIAATTHFNGVASAATVRTGVRAGVISEDGTARRVVQRAAADDPPRRSAASV